MGNVNEVRRELRFSQHLTPWQVLIRGLNVSLLLLVFVLLDDVVALAGSRAPLPLLAASGLILVNLPGYVALLRKGRHPGGAYVQIQSRHRGWAAFLTGWLALIAGLLVCALLAQSFAIQITALLRSYLDLTLPPWIWAMGVIVLLVFNNALGTHEARHGLTTPILLIAILTATILLAVPHVQVDYFAVAAERWIAPASLLVVPFIGLEISASFLREMRRQEEMAQKILWLVPGLAGLLGTLFFAVGVGVVAAEVLAVTEIPMALLGERIFGAIGKPLVLGVGALVLTLALNRVLMVVIRQGYEMGRDGYWPAILIQHHERFQTPAWLLAFVGLVLLPTVLLPAPLLGRLAGLCYLAVLAIVNWTALRREAPSPSIPTWIPSLALGLDLLALTLWEPFHLLTGAFCLGLGGALYLAYGRRHHHGEAAEEAHLPSGPGRHARSGYRVLAPIANPATARMLISLAGVLARHEDGEVIVLRVVVVPDQVPLEEGRAQAEQDAHFMDQAESLAAEEGFTVRTLSRVAHNVAQGILDTAREEDADLILLGWRGYSRAFGASLGPVIDRVIRDAPCDVTVAQGEEWEAAQKILVPTAGGPHAPIAAQLAMMLSQTYGSQVTALHVQLGRATSEQMEESRRRVAETLEGLDFSQPPEKKVIVAESVVEGVIQEAQGYDLVLLGASEEGLFDQFVFGSIPQQIAARVSKTAVIVRRYGERSEPWGRRVLRRMVRTFPRLNVEEQLELREILSNSAQPGVNYFVLIVLSSIIATLGLLLDSAAVVIGAMLVAPLMSPILGFSLGIVLGDVRLIRLAVEAVFKGVVLALTLAVLIGIVSPFRELTGEVLARTQPNLLDLTVALASGMAGAYALARKEVSAALPGVAIAAALMPPLCVAGVGLSLGEANIAVGAFLLFLANIAAISLAGVIVFFTLGIRSQTWQPESRGRLRRALVGFVLLVLVIAVPLGVIVTSILQDTATQRTIRDVLEKHTTGSEQELITFEYRSEDEQGVAVIATMRSLEPLDQAAVDEISAELGSRLDRPVTLDVIRLPFTRSEWSSEGP